MTSTDLPAAQPDRPDLGDSATPPTKAGQGGLLALQVDRLLLVATLVGLSVGAVCHLAGVSAAGNLLWAVTTTVAMVPAAWWVIDAARHRRIGVDVIALLALVGTLIVGEYVAGAVIAVMVASGRSLEGWAAGRAERELRQLVERAPVAAHRRQGAEVADVAVDAVAVGDLLLVKPGEVVPVDGRVEAGTAVVDESAVTGEALPVERGAGEAVRSGAVNGGGRFDLRATTSAADSTYAGIVRMASAAAAASAPAVRLADRYAVGFLGLNLAVAGGAWAVSGQLELTVAVLVVATPLSAHPGRSRGAGLGPVTGHPAGCHREGGRRPGAPGPGVLLFDKAGTLTAGRPKVIEVMVAGGVGVEEMLRLAASLDQVSPHVLAPAVLDAARDRHLSLSRPAGTEEVPGHGIRGRVDGHDVAVGNAAWVLGADGPWARRARRRAEREGMLTVFVAVDDSPAGALLLEHPIRPDAARTYAGCGATGSSRSSWSPATGPTWPRRSLPSSASTTCSPSAPRRKKWKPSSWPAGLAPRSWWATASTTPLRWPSPMWEWPSAPGAPPPPPSSPTWSSPSTASTVSARPW
jgi:cation transport ATPase